MTRILVVVLATVALAACGGGEVRRDGGTESDRAPGRASADMHRGTGMVLQVEADAPELCLGAVMDSLPPQCDGIRLEGWDWDVVRGEESAGGSTWGSYQVTGRYDGRVLEVVEATEPPAAPDGGADEDPIESGCPEPAGGWEMPDPSQTTEADQQRAIRAAEQEDDFAGAWIDYIGEPTEFGDNEVVLNLAFTGDMAAHEREVRRVWGGALCLVQHALTYRRLRAIQEEVGTDFDVDVLYSSVAVTRNQVELGVIAIDAQTREAIEERYGEGTVIVDARLRPVPYP